MSLSGHEDIFFAHSHLTGARWPAPPRYAFEERSAAVAAVGQSGKGMATSELDGIRKTRSPLSERTHVPGALDADAAARVVPDIATILAE